MADKHSQSWLKSLRAYVVLPLLLAGIIASLLPFVETNAWWVRFLDFARLQIAIALLLLLALYLALKSQRRGFKPMMVLLTAVALGYHAYKLYPYARPLEEMAVEVAACPAGSNVSVMIANVQKSNERAEELFEIVRQTKPDLLLVMETDQWWDRELTELNGSYEHRIQHIPENHAFFGMHLLSRYPLIDPETKFYFDSFTPTIRSDVQLPDGSRVSFFGLHPRPPHWSQPTTMRDGHLLTAALEASEAEHPAIVAGDFNATPWERVTRRTMRIGQLLDPRVGRGLYPTFDTQSWLISWPLDHVLFQERLGLQEFRELPAFGSDHYPVLAQLCHLPMIAEEQGAPALQAEDLEEARNAVQAAENRLKWD